MSRFSLSGGVEVFGFISPIDTNDTYPVIDPLYGIDGLRNVNNLTELNNIPFLRRRAGMIVGVNDGSDYYKLNPSPWNNTISDWTLLNFSGGSGTDIYTTGATLSGYNIDFTRNDNNTYSVDLSSAFSSLTGDTHITGGTFNSNNGNLTLEYNDLTPSITISGFNENNVTTGYTSGNTLILTTEIGNTIEIDLPQQSGGTSCPSGLTIYDEGVLVQSGTCEINFIGSEVQALPGGGNRVNVYIPTPTFASHWNTNDGTTNGTVSENISRTTARMSTPYISEGNPFYIGTWAATNQQATLTSNFIFTSAQDVTGFGGDSTMNVKVYAGSDVLISDYTTPFITGDTTFTSGPISVQITNYALDTLRYKAKPIVSVNIGSLFTNGSKVKVVVTHTTDSTTDGGINYTYTQNYVFYDNNPTTPQITGTTSISETNSNVITKHISGIEYYTTNSKFTVDVQGINDLNNNSQAIADNLTLTGSEYGLPTITSEPFNYLSTSFSGWTNNNNVENVSFNYTGWTLSTSNYRYRDTSANITSTPKDQWNSGTQRVSSNASILIDTYVDNSTDLNETFLGESKRWSDSGFTTMWDSTQTLVDGQALVMGGQMMIPSVGTTFNGSGNTGTNANWTTYKPDLNGVNPNYTTLSGSSSYFRKFLSGNNDDLSNFKMTFTGTFYGGDALTDLINEDLQIFIRKIGNATNTGLTGTTAPANNLHGISFGPYYDQGITDGQIRTSGDGNVITGTFGVYTCKIGVYCEIKINRPEIKISSITLSFNS